MLGSEPCRHGRFRWHSCGLALDKSEAMQFPCDQHQGRALRPSRSVNRENRRPNVINDLSLNFLSATCEMCSRRNMRCTEMDLVDDAFAEELALIPLRGRRAVIKRLVLLLQLSQYLQRQRLAVLLKAS